MHDSNIVRNIAPGVDLIIPVNVMEDYNINEHTVTVKDHAIRVKLTPAEDETIRTKFMNTHATKFAVNYVQIFVNYFAPLGHIITDALSSYVIKQITNLYKERVILPADDDNFARCMADFEKEAKEIITDAVKMAICDELVKTLAKEDPQSLSDVAKTLGVPNLTGPVLLDNIDLYGAIGQYIDHVRKDFPDKTGFLWLIKSKLN